MAAAHRELTIGLRRMTLFDFIVCLGIGFVAGTLGGMLGIGGSLIMIPAMAVLFGTRLADAEGAQHLYQASAMIINIVVAASALPKHMRKGAVRYDALKGMVIAALVTIGLGVYLSNQIDGEQLARLFALFLAYVVYVNARRLKGEIMVYVAQRRARQEGVSSSAPSGAGAASEEPVAENGAGPGPITPDQAKAVPGEERITLPQSAFVGSVVGTIAGLLGIGGGAIAVPLQQMVFRGVTLQQCIGTSIAVMSMTAGVGAVLKNITLPDHGVSVLVSLKLALALLPGAMFGGYLGSILAHRLPTPWIRGVFIVLLAVAAAKMAGLI